MANSDLLSGVGADLASGAATALWSDLPVRTLVRVDRSHALRRDYTMVVLKTRDLLTGVAVQEHLVGPLSFARLHILTSGGVPVGYVLAAPRCRIRERPTYCCISLRGQPATNAGMLFTDGTLSVTGDDSAILALVHDARRWSV